MSVVEELAQYAADLMREDKRIDRDTAISRALDDQLYWDEDIWEVLQEYCSASEAYAAMSPWFEESFISDIGDALDDMIDDEVEYVAVFRNTDTDEEREVQFSCDCGDEDAIEGAAMVAFQEEYPYDHDPLEWLCRSIEVA